ncbi:hypothetical protein [Cryptosporangium arvum]|jgi:hypothetical protein|uniref:Uncharacterized protein n=1 Tax=Cryptosporangium arvum DSM 44712 TaxID=927661 RepID=A0A010ZNA8_9ACTN|nr:hypothetical protein [Cryptosporangium arvum]EXG80169.1 hypothetical protein CryarDRAFT_1235 [Cryptosporangium arvum DSM 44712]
MTPTELEHRLTTALRARAEQVTAADLRPPAPPAAGRRAPNRWILATVTMAAALLAIAVFVVIAQVREEPIRPSHQPPPTSAPSTGSTPGTTPAKPETGPSDGPLETTPSEPATEVPGATKFPNAEPTPSDRPLPPETSRGPASSPQDPTAAVPAETGPAPDASSAP